jgi:hypothetical protein
MRVVAQYPAENQPLATDGRIELAFNRYLLPSTVTRQTFQLHVGSAQAGAVNSAIAYDPVARIVTITPPSTDGLQVDQAAVVVLDPGALQAIDGARLDPAQATTFTFPVVAGDGGAAPTQAPIDFCRDIAPIFMSSKCAGCHGPPLFYAGLSFSSLESIAETAIGKAAHGANTGPQSIPESPGPTFGVDMPIIDQGSGVGSGDPANSWLMYKVLLAVPPATPSTAYTSCDGGAYTPTDVSRAHLAVQPALADEVNDPERVNLSNQVLGREMPFPSDPAAPLQDSSTPLTVDELERVSLWIATATAADGGVPLLPSAACGCVQ